MEKYLQYIGENPIIALLVGLLLIVLGTLIALIVSNRLLKSLEKFARTKTQFTGDEKLLEYLKTPVNRLILIIGAYYFLDVFSASFGETFEKYIDGIFYVIIVLQISITIARLLEKGMNLFANMRFGAGLVPEKEKFPFTIQGDFT